MSEPLIHVSRRALVVLAKGELTHHDYETIPAHQCPCGADLKGIDIRHWVSIPGVRGDAPVPSLHPTPTCAAGRIAWDTVVERAGGAR